MTLFEFASVAASLLASFAAVRLLAGLSTAVEARRRYWVHTGWILLGLLFVTTNWWTYWSYRAVEWNYYSFLLSLLPLALSYMMAALLAPEGATEVDSWRSHFERVRLRFFGLFIAYILVLIACTVVLLGHPLIHSRRAIPLSMIVVFFFGMSSGSSRVQAVALCVFLAIGLGAALVFVEPGAFGVAP